MISIVDTNVMDLSVPERIQLVEDIWDTITEHPEQIQLTRRQMIELDERLDSCAHNPEEGDAWETVRERIRSRRI